MCDSAITFKSGIQIFSVKEKKSILLVNIQLMNAVRKLGVEKSLCQIETAYSVRVLRSQKLNGRNEAVQLLCKYIRIMFFYIMQRIFLVEVLKLLATQIK